MWHAHTATQKLDGVFGSFIVRSPPQDEPYQNLYDFDLANHVIVINDWFKEEATGRFPGRRAGAVHQNADAFLINGKGRYIVSLIFLLKIFYHRKFQPIIKIKSSYFYIQIFLKFDYVIQYSSIYLFIMYDFVENFGS